ncbi:MAG: hypothetical protein HY290_30635 [Planctomycetia bacterium]|nr:hypothetical protein [Planctomycetia bacterium]
MAQNSAAPTEAESADDEPVDREPLATADAADEVDLIRDQLREKDQLVAALTERLEQAAEQLDRLRRTGADKGRRPQGGGLPAELVDEHKSTLDDLKRVITNWENIQAGAALGRIETQIVELRDLIVTSGVPQTSATPAVPAAAAAIRERAAEKPAPAARPADSAPRPGGKPGGNAWWEAQKAALMGEPVSPEVQAALSAQPAADAESQHATQSAGAVDLTDFPIPDLPAPIDFDALTLDEACAAIRERDRLLEQLREPILLWKAVGQLPAGLTSAADAPAALKDCIAQLEAQWQAKFRQAELDLSLERARVARECNAIKQQQDVVQKGSKGGGAPAKAGRDAGPADDESASKRRWFRFMGTPEDENAGDAGQKK